MLQINEIKNLLGIMTVSFPNYKITDAQLTADLWKEMFKDYTYEEVSAGLKNYIATDSSGFAPSIGQIIDKIHNIKEMPNEVSSMAVWSQVMTAIQNSNYGAVEEFNKLPKVAQEVIGSPSALREMGGDNFFKIDDARKSFEIAYNKRLAYYKQLNRMPNDIKNRIEQKREQNKELEDKENGNQ